MSNEQLKIESLIRSMVRRILKEQYVMYTPEYFKDLTEDLYEFVKKKGWNLTALRGITIEYCKQSDQWTVIK